MIIVKEYQIILTAIYTVVAEDAREAIDELIEKLPPRDKDTGISLDAYRVSSVKVKSYDF